MMIRKKPNTREGTMKEIKRRRAMMVLWGCISVLALCAAGMLALLLPVPAAEEVQIPGAVSYTHLTLPTICSV